MHIVIIVIILESLNDGRLTVSYRRGHTGLAGHSEPTMVGSLCPTSPKLVSLM
jgi:hypothetical protein